MNKRLNILPGDKFGQLTIIKEIDKKYNHRRFLCKCSCGNIIPVMLFSLTTGNTTKCRSCASTKHGLLKDVGRGKFRGTKLSIIYSNMLNRCLNPNEKCYLSYGGRGISVCDEWLGNFIGFYQWALSSGYKEGLSIDRIDVNGNYEPNNCRWVTMKQQENNKSNNHYLKFDGKTHTLSEWAEIVHISYGCLKSRIRNGWSIESALTTPQKKVR